MCTYIHALKCLSNSITVATIAMPNQTTTVANVTAVENRSNVQRDAVRVTVTAKSPASHATTATTTATNTIGHSNRLCVCSHLTDRPALKDGRSGA